MTKIAYLQCPTGIAGDMCLGALVDAGVPFEYLQDTLQKLGIDHEYHLHLEQVQRQGQRASKFHVDVLTENHSHDHSHHHHHHIRARLLPEIEQLIQRANLPPRASDWSLQIFRQLAQAEGAVHGVAPEEVHFHEVGATDAIVDIVGTCLGLDWLDIDKLYCSPLPTGGGTVKAAHGILNSPVPAVLQMWQTRNVPLYSNELNTELVTPTGAAIVVTLVEDFIPPPAMRLAKVGLGAGSKDLPLANILRLWIGEQEIGMWGNGQKRKWKELKVSPSTETIAVLETQIDDLSPQAIGYTFDALFKVGAVDVFTQGIGMKKSRPGVLLTVICHPDKVDACERVIFRETTTLGIRRQFQERNIVEREIQVVATKYGKVRIKVARQGNQVINVQPEFEDCAQLAREHNLAWLVVQQTALCAWYGS